MKTPTKTIIAALFAVTMPLGLVVGPAVIPAAPIDSASADPLHYSYAPGWKGYCAPRSNDFSPWRVAPRYVHNANAWNMPRKMFDECIRVGDVTVKVRGVYIKD